RSRPRASRSSKPSASGWAELRRRLLIVAEAERVADSDPTIEDRLTGALMSLNEVSFGHWVFTESLPDGRSRIELLAELVGEDEPSPGALTDALVRVLPEYRDLHVTSVEPQRGLLERASRLVRKAG